MDNRKLEQIKSFYSQNLDQKKSWYSSVADAYNKVRPRYPEKLIDRVSELARLSPRSIILEVGCGPGTATVAFAKCGFNMVCLEPNREFYQIARKNCQQYPSVEVRNISFEEWELEPKKFNAILAATSWHWVSSEIKYTKAVEVLQDNGFLILFWNKELQPQYEAYQMFEEVYQLHAPSLARFEVIEAQEEILRNLGQEILDSGQFKDLVSEQILVEVTYSTDDYLTLLCTYSPYIKLDSQLRNSLFEGLRDKIDKNLGGYIQLSYLSTFQIAQKL